MSEVAIKVENLSKKYQIGKARSGTLMDTLAIQWHSIFSPKSNKEDFWALKDVSFEVKKGEVLGVIGRNGAGKSTLLKILSRITEPTTGRIELNGRVASLLEVGTGFHPELTGRENIFLNGALLGMTRQEIKSKFDEIVDFSGVEQFIDTPVKKYSSGMYVRLAFAVAAHLDSEILLVDEVLAVGDMEFQRKCLGKMEEVASRGKTVLLVSHNLATIKDLCKIGMLIESGKTSPIKNIQVVVKDYLSHFTNTSGSDLFSRKSKALNRDLTITDCKFYNQSGEEAITVCSGQYLKIVIGYEGKMPNTLFNVIFRVQFFDHSSNNILFVCNNNHSATPFPNLPQKGQVSCIIKKLPLNKGRYYIDLQVLNNYNVADQIDVIKTFNVEPGNYFGTGKLPRINKGVLIDHSWINQ